jgi:segregation and condensation protein A
MEISYKLDNFEGPLDLLLHLIEKNKVSIYDIPIVLITEQYLEYVNQMDHEDLDVVSDFLVMAATLLDIKSRMLLPKVEKEEEEDEEDPRAELVRRLLEYKMYKFMSYELKDKMDDAANVFFKEPTLPDEVLQYREPVDPKELLAGLTLEKLNAIYKSIIRRQEDKVDPIRSKFGTIEKEEISLSDKMIEIKDFARTHRKFSFRNLLESQCSKVQVIVTFLSILELMKMGHIHVEQDGLFDDISVEVQTDPDTWKNLTEFAEDEPQNTEINM